MKTALKHRAALLNPSLTPKTEVVKTEYDNHPFGEDVKMVRQHKLQCRLLTPTEQDEAIVKYQTGMTMTAVADLYGCHYTTIGRLLRARGVEIRN